MKASDQLYNSRITRIYLEYLAKAYPEIQTDLLLTHAGMTKPEVEDSAHWFSQEQVDRFQDILVKETGNPNIAREAGRYATSSQGIGLVKRYALKFFNPANIYALTSKLIPLMTRGAAITSRRLGAARVEIVATPYPDVAEKPYQCENRIGMLESIGRQFSSQYAAVEHPECFHKGNGRCRYIIKWHRSPQLLWERIRNFVAIFDMIVLMVLAPRVSMPTLLTVTLALALKIAVLWCYCLYLEKKDLKRTVVAQGDAAQEHINEINTRHSNALLVQEVGKATAKILNRDELANAVMVIMQNRLPYDRGSILLADGDGKRLDYIAGYGFGAANESILRQISFNLTNTASKGIFVRCFHDQKPLIVEDIDTLQHQFSAKSQDLLRTIKAKSLICVPIIYENRSLGIIAIDNFKSRIKLSQSDLNLIMGMASQVALGIHNAASFQELQKSEEKYRDIFENVSDFLYTHDLEGRLLEVNRSFQRVSGYPESDLYHRQIKDLIPQRYRPDFDTYLAEIKKNGRSEGSLRLAKANGDEFILAYKNSLVYSGHQPVGVRGSARDITESLMALKEKKGLQRQLEQAKKMEAIGTLAGGVAHDLNNILSGIVSYPDLILMDLPSDSHLREPIQTIRDSGQKAATIVQDLLTMARRGVAVTEVISLNTIVTDYLASPEHKKIVSFHPEVVVDSKLDENLMNIVGSPVHLAKTLMNLISNAAEAMPDGGAIELRTENRYIDDRIRGYDVVVEGDYAVLEVADTGIGISKKDQKRIFEPFYTKKIMGRSGTGLGMSVVWATVKDHKGYINITSHMGAGTTFTLYFPVTRKTKGAAIGAWPVGDYMGKGERILVVDDVPEQRRIASGMLRRLGYEVAAASSGEDAVAMVKEQIPDLVILDMIMDPGIDGLETYRQMLEINSRQKAIITSGFSESAKVRTALQIGAGAYIKKPYLFDKIGIAVWKELHRSNTLPGQL